MYDFAHPPSDAIEKITHSLCTLEFEEHRPLYDWLIANLPVPAQPRQIEFARLNLSYTVMSKRKLLTLVEEGHVSGWDDPRMPTIVGMRRRGYPPEAIRTFCERIGVAKRENLVDVALLEHAVREDLNKRAPRVMAVLRPLRVVIENYPEAQAEEFEIGNNPEDPSAGNRTVPFSRELYIERDDFMEAPPKKFFRLAPGREVRLRGAYFITCTRSGQGCRRRDRRAALHLRSDHARRRRGRRPQGQGDAALGLRRCTPSTCEVRLYDRLFKSEIPGEAGDYRADLNPASLEVVAACKIEPSAAAAARRHPLSVRAARLLLRRSRLGSRRAGVQPHGVAQGQLGADRGRATPAAELGSEAVPNPPANLGGVPSHPTCGSHGTLVPAGGSDAASGRSICHPHAPAHAGVHGGGPGDARARHWRQHRDLQRRQRSAAAAAAVSRARGAGATGPLVPERPCGRAGRAALPVLPGQPAQRRGARRLSRRRLGQHGARRSRRVRLDVAGLEGVLRRSSASSRRSASHSLPSTTSTADPRSPSSATRSGSDRSVRTPASSARRL